jgi:hypothetical protein
MSDNCQNPQNEATSICIFAKVQRFPRIVELTDDVYNTKDRIYLNQCVMVGKPSEDCGFCQYDKFNCDF